MFRLALASLLFPVFGCLAADGAGDEAIYVVKALAATDDCSFTASTDAPFIGHGIITVFSPSPYLIHPQLKSRITTTTASEQDLKTIQIRGARVNLDFKDSAIGNLVDDENKRFQTLFTAPLAPNAGSVTNTSFELIPEGALASIAASAGADGVETEVVGKLVVFGDLAGEEVTSQEFQFPVTICSNCVTAAFGLAAYPTCPVMAAGRQGNACNPFQDGVVDCCVDSNNDVVCPAPVSLQN
jgi:hypothetical protein